MTTDITELAQSLKAAAEKATSGEWAVQFGDEVYVTNDDVGYEQVAIATLDSRDADYIALANPANVKQLVEALEKAQQRIADLESRTVKIPYLPDDCDRIEAHFKYQVAINAAGIKVEAE
ncbi:ead/Ea22-like family protein [Klebsiella michiganensis]|uniref:ead/Ea22-like family protein n=1 Tax=Klebsiella michiganensis TaxID=1134687 RepID=UPI00277CE1D9|nr:ead/Ea22-like family protein [Klebsiella michiganensis]